MNNRTGGGSGRFGRFGLSWGVRTNPGNVRDINEDSVYASTRLFCVADGMGGHARGEVASAIAVGVLARSTRSEPPQIERVGDLVEQAHRAICRQARRDRVEAMGTTLIALMAVQNGDDAAFLLLNVGDSRCYQLVNRRMRQLTVDHSLVQEMVDAGRITAAEAGVHPMKNVVTRALGMDEVALADYTVLDEVDARLLLCSDGLSGELSDAAIAEILMRFDEPQLAADELVARALEGRASDNVSAVVVDITNDAWAQLGATEPRKLDVTGPTTAESRAV